MNYFAERAKAVAAFVGSLATAVLAVVDDGQVDGNEVAAFVSVIVTAAVTWWVKNREPSDA